MPCHPGRSPKHHRIRNDSNRTVPPNRIRPDEKLFRLPMNESVCRGSADALTPDNLFQTRRNFVELIRRPERLVRSVSDHPQLPRPYHHRTSAAFSLLVHHREVRVNTADLKRRGFNPELQRAKQGNDESNPQAAIQPRKSKMKKPDHV